MTTMTTTMTTMTMTTVTAGPPSPWITSVGINGCRRVVIVRGIGLRGIITTTMSARGDVADTVDDRTNTVALVAALDAIDPADNRIDAKAKIPATDTLELVQCICELWIAFLWQQFPAFTHDFLQVSTL